MSMMQMPFFTGAGDEIVAEIPSPFVSTTLLQEIQHFRDEGRTQRFIPFFVTALYLPGTHILHGSQVLYTLLPVDVAKVSCDYIFQQVHT